MASFKATVITSLPKSGQNLSPDAVFWRTSLESIKVVKEFGAISGLDIHPFTNDILATSSSRLTIYNFNSLEYKRQFNSLTPHGIFGGTFRKSDGSLFVSGTADGNVCVYDLGGTKPLRIFNDPKTKHIAAVHRCYFYQDKQVVSLSDDKAIKLWDVAESTLIRSFGIEDATGSFAVLAHNDYIRAGCVIDSANMVVSGSYDHTVKVWDSREPGSFPVHSFDIGAPVESVVAHQSLIIASGGKTVVVYDLLSGKVLTKLSNIHSKTITSLNVHDKFLLTGSIDGHLKIFDSLYKPVTSLTYSSSQILNVAVNSKCLAVGTGDGTIMVRKFKNLEDKANHENDLVLKGQRMKRFYGTETVIVSGNYAQSQQTALAEKVAEDDIVRVGQKKKVVKELQRHDKELKKFNHSLALDHALQNFVKPQVVVSVMHELIRRSALRIALSGRSDAQLKNLIRFIIKHIRDEKFNRVLIDVATILTEIYTPHVNRSLPMKALFSKVARVVNSELILMQRMKSLAGQISMIIENS